MKSIRNRLTLAFLSAGALLLVALSLAIYAGASALLCEQFDDGLRARLQAIVSLMRWHPGAVELDYKGEFMPEFEHRGGGFFFEVWTEGAGQPLERSHSLKGADLPRFGGTIGAPEFRECTLPDGRPARAAGMLVRRGNDQTEIPELVRAPPGPGADVVVAGDTSALQSRLRKLAMEIMVGGTLGLAALAFLVRRTLLRELAPLTALSQRAAELTADSLGERFVATNLPSELEPITARLNALLTRLEQAFAQERRFSANVAHELRTPIAELLSLAEVGQRLADTNRESTAFFNDAAEIARRMNATVSTLLLLARFESGRQPVERVPVSLREFIEAECVSVARAAEQHGISFQCAARDGSIETDPALFQRLCHILFENALDYTAPGGSITMTAGPGELVISNGPVSLEAVDLPHLFERFWRKDPARADMRHSGLGLALAAELGRTLEMELIPALDARRTFHIRIVFPKKG